MSLNDFAPWIAILIAAASFLYPILNGRSKKIDARLDAIEAAQKHDREQAIIRTAAVKAESDLVKDRVVKLEADMAHLPDKDVTHRLEMTLAAVQTEMGRLSERVKPIAAMAERIQEVMVEKVMS